MALNSTQFRDAIKPQDMVAVVITLLGIAIVLFLDDAIIKLIGGSIAVLGMVALYVTIRQRVDDQIQLRTRRTTLPPPAFKTRVTHDPSTSTKRILFDDFQATFAPADDDIQEDPLEGFSVASSGVGEIRPVTPVPVTAPDRAPATGTAPARQVKDANFVDATGESFRVVKAGKNEEPATTSASVASPSVPVAGSTPKLDEKPASQPVPVNEPAASQKSVQSASEPVIVPPTLEEVRQELTPTRKQAQFILEDLVSDGDEDMKGSEPRSEFVRLVGQVLNAIARSIQARSIVYFWVNLEKGHLIPEAKVTTGSIEIRSGQRIPLGNDVVSQIARSGVPEVITDITSSAERELISYYAGPANTRSFVGVPVFFRREVVGVLAADSTDENGFDEVSVATLAEYTRLISGLIRSYTEKYDLHLIARTLDAFEKMGQGFSGAAPSPTRTADLLAEQIAELFDTLYVSVVLFDEEARDWKIAACHSELLDSRLRGLAPDMRSSLVGRSTRFAEEILLEEIGNEIRFAPGEQLAPGGTFLSIPLVATTKCYGTIAIEHPGAAAYIPRDIDLMRDLAHYAAMAIEVFNTNRAIESHVMHDEVTGLYNSEFLLAALEREIARARDFKQKLSFALISIDMPSSLRAENSIEIEEIIAASVGAVIEHAIRPYDTVGRYSPQLFGVVLVNRNDQDAYIWAEKLRKDVASRILALGQRKSAVTISVGISDLSIETTSRDAMVNGARQALDKARSGEGNAVILY